MATPPTLPSRSSGGRRRKPLNLTLIKSVIVMLVGGVNAIVSALSGLGANASFAPMLRWMLGFSEEKAYASAMRYALSASTATIVTAIAVGKAPPHFLLNGLALMFGATLGAVLAAKPAVVPAIAGRRVVFQTIGVAVSVFVVVQTARMNIWQDATYAHWNAAWMLVCIGIVIGAMTQFMALASGILLVPALYYLASFSPPQAMLLSLLVVALASILPAFVHAGKGMVEGTYSPWAMAGGAVGGFIGALALAKAPDRLLLYVFAVVAMLLCARELARASISSKAA